MQVHNHLTALLPPAAGHLLDSVPADVAAAVTLAAAAALVAGVSSPQQLRAATAAAADAATNAATAGNAPAGSSKSGSGAATIDEPPGAAASTAEPLAVAKPDVDVDVDVTPPNLSSSAIAGGSHVAQGGSGGDQMLVFHAATSTVSPCMHWEAYMMVHRAGDLTGPGRGLRVACCVCVACCCSSA
jgi:hypothetical protein